MSNTSTARWYGRSGAKAVGAPRVSDIPKLAPMHRFGCSSDFSGQLSSAGGQVCDRVANPFRRHRDIESGGGTTEVGRLLG